MKKLLVFTVALGLFACAKITPEEIKNADYGSYPSNYESIVKGYFNQVAKDPDSLKYRTISNPRKSFVNDFGEHKFGYMSCATVNGKNSYGAYVGYKTTGILIKNGQIIHIVSDVDETNRLYGSKFCQPIVD